MTVECMIDVQVWVMSTDLRFDVMSCHVMDGRRRAKILFGWAY